MNNPIFSSEALHAGISAYEDATGGDRLPDGDGHDEKIVAAIVSAVLRISPPTVYKLMYDGTEPDSCGHMIGLYASRELAEQVRDIHLEKERPIKELAQQLYHGRKDSSGNVREYTDDDEPWNDEVLYKLKGVFFEETGFWSNWTPFYHPEHEWQPKYSITLYPLYHV
jgi:hypothetical protein